MNDNDSILRYYEAEMRYLRESGKAFAKAHPDRARLLNLDRVGDRDPYVERLFEGFAFLTGRLRQKLDDELPELTEGLVSLLWPHYLRMIPSLSIVELIPFAQKLQKTEVLPAGIPVRSAPVNIPSPGGDGSAPRAVQCRYRTTQPVALQPIAITHAGPGVRHDGRSVIRIGFALEGSALRNETDLSRLRLHLNADLPTAFAMHLALTRQVDAIHWRIPEVRDGEPVPLTAVTIEPAGFSTEERLWPKADAAFSGYQLLLEYFTFREKFLFVDLCGLDVTKLPEGATRFELEIVLKHAYPSDQRFNAENLRLFCTPVINLFELDAEPIEIDHHETEYRVVPAGHQGEHVETYSVDAVATFDHDTAERYEYVPFATFRHRGGMLRHEAPERYFHTRVRPGMSGLHETWVILGGHAWETMDTLPEESLSLRVTGTNGMLPRKGLREASLEEVVVSSQSVAGVRNLVSPTMPLYPPTEDRFQWRVLSHLAPNFLSMMNAEVLRGALALYDWTDDELNRRRLAGILHVSQELIEEVSGGAVERGVLIEVTLDSHAFSGEGDVMLFGELLHRFFAAYAEINLFTKLAIVSLPAQVRTEWPRSKASRAAL
ncbi:MULTISPECIES: type VI secretion system baseplate subunit TssF [unclassified Burkholderia]|uniref:type VI secretion system baseplate subunit TssF n=1 Tax=unclassified Burkholderia TaxID=2613784 RepID=UPI000F55E1FF|nr:MULTISPECIES: type VI secretion system baseplate subunit TssF [unclassified Burkholderia]RQR42158.1 type VI secretion system baseplate subunit TssF [Burkholderia sp. Bp9142]RQR56550.1 type VI secretion system baseplate subunit TssF [Burkholderia sp. Bp9140]